MNGHNDFFHTVWERGSIMPVWLHWQTGSYIPLLFNLPLSTIYFYRRQWCCVVFLEAMIDFIYGKKCVYVNDSWFTKKQIPTRGTEGQHNNRSQNCIRGSETSHKFGLNLFTPTSGLLTQEIIIRWMYNMSWSCYKWKCCSITVTLLLFDGNHGKIIPKTATVTVIYRA